MTEPPIALAGDIVRAAWIGGPHEDTAGAVVVSFTDFRANTEEDQEQIFEIGLRLRETWPVMHGAIGLWLWAKPGELRGGSLSIWQDHDALRRFVRWPTHVATIRDWRERISVASTTWESENKQPAEVWARAEQLIRQAPPRRPTHEPRQSNLAHEVRA